MPTQLMLPKVFSSTVQPWDLSLLNVSRFWAMPASRMPPCGAFTVDRWSPPLEKRQLHIFMVTPLPPGSGISLGCAGPAVPTAALISLAVKREQVLSCAISFVVEKIKKIERIGKIEKTKSPPKRAA